MQYKDVCLYASCIRIVLPPPPASVIISEQEYVGLGCKHSERGLSEECQDSAKVLALHSEVWAIHSTLLLITSPPLIPSKWALLSARCKVRHVQLAVNCLPQVLITHICVIYYVVSSLREINGGAKELHWLRAGNLHLQIERWEFANILQSVWERLQSAR